MDKQQCEKVAEIRKNLDELRTVSWSSYKLIGYPLTINLANKIDRAATDISYLLNLIDSDM